MDGLSKQASAFVRPSPTSTNLGGNARGTYEAILLCEAAGFDRVIVETVGVGQSETAVRDLTDAFLLLMLPEEAMNCKASSEASWKWPTSWSSIRTTAEQLAVHETASQYQQALRLFPPNPGGHTVQVQSTSALEKRGIEYVANAVDGLINQWSQNGWFESQRQSQQLRQLDGHV